MSQSIAAALLAKHGGLATPRMVPIQCVSTSPFKVLIEGGDEPVDALRIAGQAFDINDRGLALWAPPLAPICLKTT